MYLREQSEIKKYVFQSVAYVRLEPLIKQTEDNIIKPLLGKEMADKLQEYYDAPNASELMEQLFDFVQEAESNLAYALYVKGGGISITDDGISRKESETFKQAYQYQERNAIEQYLQAGYNAVDKMLDLLEENIEDVDFEAWKVSAAATNNKSLIINTPSEFTAVWGKVNNSRLIYLTLRPYSVYVEDFEMVELLGRAFFDEIKTAIKDRSTDAKYTAIIPMLQKIVGHYTVAEATAELNIDVSDRGLYFEKLAANTFGNNTERTRLKDAEAANFVSKEKERALGYVRKLNLYLLEHLTDYPAYGEYTNGTEVSTVIEIDNTNKKTFTFY